MLFLFLLAEPNNLGNFRRGYYEEPLCEIILKLDLLSRCSWKYFLFTALVANLFG